VTTLADGALSIGSGFFVAPDLVVTAGHVLVMAPGPTAAWPNASDITVECNGQALKVSKVAGLNRWLRNRSVTGDIALLQLDQPFGSAIPLPPDEDFDPTNLDVKAVGRLGGAIAGPFGVSITRKHEADGFDTFVGALLAPSGVSGGPFVMQQTDGKVIAVGVVTDVTTDPAIEVVTGVPLLEITYGELLATLA
jgi:hypothetical protein